ncbi:Zinc finger and BTB domain-containing protein 40 [Anthophora plagiata]
MFKSASFDQIDKIYNENEMTEEYEHKVNTDDILQTEEYEHKVNDIFLPKIEPLCLNETNSNENTSSIEEMLSPIPFTTPYKVKDPIILLEKCDKIWETLQVIKNMQCKGKSEISNKLSSETTSKSLYIEYNPVLSNNNSAIPNFKFSVKTKKKLFSCSTCGKRYTRNLHLKYHLERAHGIRVPPKRIRNVIFSKKNIDKEKEKEKEPNNAEKGKDNSEKVHLKKGESKLYGSASSQSISPSVTTSSSHIQRGRRNILIHNSDNTSENVKKGQERKVLSKELKQNEKSVPPQHDLTSLMCILCKRIVKDMRKHLIDYHKIESPDFMLKNLNQTPIPSGNEESKALLSDNEVLTNSPITQEKSPLYFDKKDKRKSNVSFVNSRKRCRVNSNTKIDGSLRNNLRHCEICYGVYTHRSYLKHAQTHRLRGETKENFHLFSCKYINSPLFKHTPLLNMSNAFVKNRVHLHRRNTRYSSVFKDKEIQEQILQNDKYKELLNAKYNGQQETICSCGRLFRNPHTLFMHKKQCKILPDEVRDSSTENSSSESSQYVNKNCYARDSGIGISITIKKKNNSYEIIDKDNKNGNQFQNIGLSKDYAQIKSQNFSYEDLESSKYSENHSILKIESIDEDIDIDIEEDSQTNFSNDDITSSTSKMNDLHKEINKQEIKVIQSDEPFRENVNSEVLQKELTNYQFNVNKLNSNQKYKSCVCGRKFYTRRALHVHISKHDASSELLCGYCKVRFSNVIAWHEHKCSINKGKKFTDIQMEITCCYCNETACTYKQFDQHIKLNHFDSARPYQCFHCRDRFPNTTLRKIHFDKEHMVTACLLCDYKCYNVMKPRHRAYHYGLGFPCHVCKKTYSSKSALVNHDRKVHLRNKTSKRLRPNKNIEIES